MDGIWNYGDPEQLIQSIWDNNYKTYSKTHFKAI